MLERKLSRRGFLRLALASSVSTAVGGVGAFAYAHEVAPGQVEIVPVTLTLPRLAPEFDGYRLVQISDIHMNWTWMSHARLAGLVDMVNAQQADLIAITGDFVTMDPEVFAGPLVSELGRLQARDGAVAVLGNHDHWTNRHVIRAVLDTSGVINVSNGVHTLERDGKLLNLAGLDDYLERVARLDKVFAQLPNEGAAILLVHEPDFADQSAATGRFDLQLSGHSHGGQVIAPFWGPLVLPRLAKKYPLGRYQVGTMIQYTNRGLGMTSPQVRINCPPEITVFTLRAPLG